jgi:hypothetical protein
MAKGFRMKPFHLLIVVAALFGTWPATASPAAPDANAIRDRVNRELRVAAIAQKILAANLESCPRKSPQYGLGLARLDEASSPQLRLALTEALGLREYPTAFAVVPGSVSALAGIRADDRIVAINGVKWPTGDGLDVSARKAFWDAFQSGQQSAVLQVDAERGDQPVQFHLTGKPSCTASVFLINQSSENATAFGSRIEIHSALEALLQDDSELAFIISHEVAHVILEHSGPGKEAQIKDKVVRQRIEIEADELGVLLMARAGFDPAAAARAESRRYQTNGPVTRGLGLNGVYMPPKERDAFLAKRADEVRLQLEAEAGKR